MSRRILYHGSPDIIQTPVLGKGKPYNDYGQGFYCTEHPELAKEWACTENIDGYANKYEMDTDGLAILNLSADEYTILHWLALLMKYRRFRISTPVMKRGADWLREHFLIDLTSYDVVVGYRADDSYFSFARSFVNNEISLAQLSYAMRLGRLGEQFVLKSPAAFEKFGSFLMKLRIIRSIMQKERLGMMKQELLSGQSLSGMISTACICGISSARR